jgi:hypothetical protein
MPRSTPYFYETTAFEPTTGAEAGIVSIPAAVIREHAQVSDLADPSGFAENLGIRLGVPIPSPDDIPEVFFASLAQRVYAFDDRSFERWRAQRREVAADPRAQFAVELATREFVAAEQSPLHGVSLTSLATRGMSWTVGGWQMAVDHPMRGLGVVVLGEFGIVVASVTRAFREEAYLATRYHLRRFFRVPPDWRP